MISGMTTLFHDQGAAGGSFIRCGNFLIESQLADHAVSFSDIVAGVNTNLRLLMDKVSSGCRSRGPSLIGSIGILGGNIKLSRLR